LSLTNRTSFKRSFTSFAGYPLVLVALASLLRSIPIIIAWPYAVGFDTNASYLAWMYEGFPNSVSLLFRDTLLSQVFMNFIFLIYSNPFEILNAFAIIFQAGLALSVYLYARSVAKLGKRFAFAAGLIFTVSLLTFRLTWDQYRVSLALIFALLTWVILSVERHKRVRYFAVLLGVLITLSNPLPAALFIGSMTIHLMFKVSQIRKMWIELLTTIIAASLLVAQLLLIFSGPVNTASIAIEGLRTFGGTAGSLNGLSYFFFMSWPLLLLLPFAVLHTKNEYHWIWLFLVLAIALLGPILGLGVFSLWIYWLIGFPLSILFGIALQRSGATTIMKYLGIASILISLVLVIFWVTSTPESANWYFTKTLNPNDTTPVGYLQTTVDLPYQNQLMILLNKSINSIPRNSTIYLPGQFYGFALTVSNHNHVNLVNIGVIDPNQFSTSFAEIESRTGSYTLWLTNPNGWFGVYAMPSNFNISIYGGRFSLYYIGSS
jgi:hypothetical protein